jgi:hypothetical protein
MLAMYCAVFAARKFTPRKAILQDLVTDKNMQNATVGCMMAGFMIQIALILAPKTSGSFLSALSQINRFFPMAIILGVIHQIRKSGGRSSINLPVLFAGANILYLGLVGFSKEGIFTPLACWLAAVSCQNYRLSRTQIVAISGTVALMFVYLVPYAQYGRNLPDPEDSLVTRIETVSGLLSNLDFVREEYKATIETSLVDQQQHGYFGKDVGFFDRLQMISMDDSLIELTDRLGPHGISPLIQGVENLVPHFLWANKPVAAGGNTYAHEVGGILAENDDTTGISFSPMGEGYHLAKWMGILLAAPVLWTMLFTLFDSLCGDVRLSPWGLLIIVYYAHMAPEGGLGGVIYAMGYIAFALIVAATSAAYLMPILGTLFKGPERTGVKRLGPVRSFSRRNSELPSASAGQ